MVSDADRSGRRRVRGAVPRDKRLDLRVSEEELLELRRLAGERGISIQRMLVDDALARRPADGSLRVGGGVIDELVGELMGVRGELGRAGNVANQVLRDARWAGFSESRVEDALVAVREVAQAAADVRGLIARIGGLR